MIELAMTFEERIVGLGYSEVKLANALSETDESEITLDEKGETIELKEV